MIGSRTQHGLKGKLQLGDYLNARARIKINRYRRDYAAKNIAFAPEILSVAGKIHPEFLRLLRVLADMQTLAFADNTDAIIICVCNCSRLNTSEAPTTDPPMRPSRVCRMSRASAY